MENREWLNEYMSLKQINPADPFTVPVGYFDELGDRITALKNIEALKVDGSSGGFAVPESYFGELNQNINSRITIEGTFTAWEHGFMVPDGYFDNLHQQISSRIVVEEALAQPAATFEVPEGYFDNLQAQIQSRIAVEEALGQPAEAFEVPEGYFNNLQEQIQSRIFFEEKLSKPVEAFIVPEGYFETLNAKILNSTVTQDAVRNKGVVRKLFASTAFKYATAACFALVIGAGVLLNELSNPATDHQHSFLHKELSTVPVSDIQSYLQLNLDPTDTQQTAVSENAPINDKELEDALDEDLNSVQ